MTVGGAFPMGGKYYPDYKVDRKKVRGIVSRNRFVSSLAEQKSLHIFLQTQYIPHLIATVCGINNQHDVFYNHVTKLSQQPLELVTGNQLKEGVNISSFTDFWT